MTKRGSVPVGLSIAALCVAFTTACASMSAGAPSQGPDTAAGSGSQAGPSSAAPSSAPAAASTAPASAAGTCTAAQLSVKADGGGAAGGQAELLLEITNQGTATCTLSGYPAVVGRLPSGATVHGTDTEHVMLGMTNQGSGPNPVAIAPGGQAWVPLNFLDNPLNGATSCPSFSSFTVTPPGVDRAYPVKASGSDCDGIRVPPVLPAGDVVTGSGG
jgi:Protein of unknown function (DUF4232)